MNVYFLVEGKTERKVYPKWLAHLTPKIQKVDNPTDVVDNQYYLISGGGYPGMLDNHFLDSVADVNQSGQFDYLVLILDTDDQMPDEKITEVEQFIQEKSIKLFTCKLVIIPQVICMETWFLGNGKIYSRVPPNAECAVYANHYDVANSDPELMRKQGSFNGTNADFHYEYLKTMLRAKNIRYSKANPQAVHEAYYLDELKNRVATDSTALNSLGNLFKFFTQI